VNKDCPVCGEEEVIRGYWRNVKGKGRVFLYPDVCSKCWKKHKAEGIPDMYQSLIKENNSRFNHKNYNEKGISFVRIDEVINSPDGDQTIIAEVTSPQDYQPYPSPESALESSEYLSFLRELIGRPATYIWNDPSTGIINSFSTGNPEAYFRRKKAQRSGREIGGNERED
jgi:hypothetical protein